MAKQSMKEATEKTHALDQMEKHNMYYDISSPALGLFVFSWWLHCYFSWNRAYAYIMMKYKRSYQRPYFAPCRIILNVLFRNNYIVHNLISATVEIFNFLI